MVSSDLLIPSVFIAYQAICFFKLIITLLEKNVSAVLARVHGSKRH